MQTTTNRPRKSGFRIGVTCPGCGAELELQDDFFVLECASCASVLRVVMPETPPAYLVRHRKEPNEARFQADRYCKENQLPLTSSGCRITPFYYPYWKIDAIALKVRHTTYEVEYGDDEDGFSQPQTEEKEFTAINLAPFTATCAAGQNLPGVPVSIGMRADYIRMVPFAQEQVNQNFVCGLVTVPVQEAQARLTKGAVDLGRLDTESVGRNVTELYDPTAAIVYFPYVRVESASRNGVRIFIADGVTGKIVGTAETESPTPDDAGGQSGTTQFGALNVSLHRCRNCGVDLPATKSYVYQCHNCKQIAFLERHPLIQSNLAVIGSAVGKADTLFPFWSLQLSEQDSSALRRVFGGIFGSNRVMVPAFRVRNFEVIYRLSKRMSAASAKLTFNPLESLSQQSLPVTLPLHEALSMVEVLWRREMVSKEGRVRLASGFAPVAGTLTYVPFHPEQYFFVDSILKTVTFERGIII